MHKKYNTIEEVLAAADSAQQAAKAKGQDAFVALQCLFKANWKARGDRKVVYNKHSLGFQPHPHDQEAWEHDELRDLLSRVRFYPWKVVVEVASLEGWWAMENWEKEWYWEELTLFQGEEAEELFQEVAQQLIEQAEALYRCRATRVWSDPGLPDLESYLERNLKDPDFEREFEARMVKRNTKACGHTGECDCIPF